MVHGLKRARALLEENGWVGPEREPMCATSDGGVCLENDEAVSRFSVSGVLLTTGCYPAGWEVLESVIAPATVAWQRFQAVASVPSDIELRHFTRLARAATLEQPLHLWLREPQRTKVDVLRLFVRAIERTKKQSGERR